MLRLLLAGKHSFVPLSCRGKAISLLGKLIGFVSQVQPTFLALTAFVPRTAHHSEMWSQQRSYYCNLRICPQPGNCYRVAVTRVIMRTVCCTHFSQAGWYNHSPGVSDCPRPSCSCVYSFCSAGVTGFMRAGSASAVILMLPNGKGDSLSMRLLDMKPESFCHCWKALRL